MYETLFVRPWPWWVAGPAIGAVVAALAWVTGKALGVSTAYGSACALTSRLPFFKAREYGDRWRLAFAAGIPLGGVLAMVSGSGWAPTLAFGQLDVMTQGSLALKGSMLLVGGVFIGAGARWAGGCPSGHTIVGIALGGLSSVVATVGFMLGGFAVYNLLYAMLGG